MNAHVILSVLIPLFTILLSSNLFATEMFTDFQVTYPNSNGTGFAIYNTGIIQAKNVSVHILFDLPYDSVKKSDCIEGQIIPSEKSSIHLKFLRMSPGIQCVFDVNHTGDNIVSVTILSDDRSAKSYPESSDMRVYFWNFYTILAFLIIGQVFFIISGFVVIRDNVILYVFSRHHKSIECWRKIRGKIKCTYNVKINAYDVSILCCIACKIDTLSQISAHTKISKTYVKKRVTRMRENDIILDTKNIAISPDLEKYLLQICKKQK